MHLHIVLNHNACYPIHLKNNQLPLIYLFEYHIYLIQYVKYQNNKTNKIKYDYDEKDRVLKVVCPENKDDILVTALTFQILINP